jgi:hypothetical protein
VGFLRAIVSDSKGYIQELFQLTVAELSLFAVVILHSSVSVEFTLEMKGLVFAFDGCMSDAVKECLLLLTLVASCWLPGGLVQFVFLYLPKANESMVIQIFSTIRLSRSLEY